MVIPCLMMSSSYGRHSVPIGQSNEIILMKAYNIYKWAVLWEKDPLGKKKVIIFKCIIC